MRIASIIQAEYDGDGIVLFRGNIKLEGSFTIQLYTGGVCTLTFTVKFPDQLTPFKALSELTRADVENRSVKRENFEASFTGKSSDGGYVDTDWMSLDKTHIDITKTDVQATLDPTTGQFFFNPFDAIKNSTILEGCATLEFIIGSKVEIKYETISPEYFVSVFTGITNFIFRGNDFDSSSMLKNYFIRDELLIQLDEKLYEFIKLPHYDSLIEFRNYDSFMNELKSKQVDVTCECLFLARYKDLSGQQSALSKILYILSFATCNWLATLYENIYRDNKLVCTILLPHKTFPYIGGQYAINPTSTEQSPLKRLVEIGYEEYCRFEELLGLKFIIEDYIMSPREGNLEARYLMLAIAMETVASYAPAFAARNGRTITNKIRKEKEKEIIDISKKMKNNLSDQFMEEMLRVGGYNDLRLKDKIRYIFDELRLFYTEKELSNFVKYRNIMVHAGISRDTKKLSHEWHNLTNLFDRLILTILAWKGNHYVDKSKDYTEQILI